MAGDRTGRGSHLRWLVGLLVVALLAACSGNVDLDTEDPEPTPSSATPEVRPISEAQEPGAAYSLVASTDAAALAVAASRTYVNRAQVAVLAPRDDRDAVLRAASIGQAVGAPVLLTGAQDGTLDTELVRLGVVGIVTVGAADLDAIDTTSLVVAPAPEDAAALGELLGTSVRQVELPAAAPEADDIAALLALGEGEVFAPGTGESSSGSESDETADATSSGDPDATDPAAVGELPELGPPTTIDGSVVIADGDPAQLAAVATSRAAGASVIRSTGDIRANGPAITELSELAPSTVVGLGTSLGDEDLFSWRTATAATGVQLPGGGQLVFGGKRYIALYGSPVTPALGLLGEQGTPETIALAADYASRYAGLTTDTVVPALEIIVTVASAGAGDDGNYSQEWSSAEFVPLIEAAAAAGQYVVLDFQPGRTSFLDQVQQYQDLLAYPHVGIALDPEWRLGPDQQHLQQIGSVGIDEVNATVAYVADFVREHQLPQKLIVLHQFQLRMIADRAALDTSRSEVALLIHADGQGGQGAKQATWRALHDGAPAGIYWGWKNFIDEDTPMLTPEQTYGEVVPIPDFVSYQ